MKKSELQKPIKQLLLKCGFSHTKGDDYSVISKDEKTRLILRIPDGKKGFILGAQFLGLGEFDGVFSHSVMRQFDYAYELAFASSKDYSEDEIILSAEKVAEGYRIYLESGFEAIKSHIDEWTFGDLDELLRDKVLRYFGLPGIDPYSDEQLMASVERLKDGGRRIISWDEYSQHKSFYDRFTDFGGTITFDESGKEVYIDFFGA